MKVQPFLTISGVAELMQASGDEGTSLSRMARVRRALDAGAFAGSFQSGANTAAWMIPTAEAKAWIDAGCPTPSEIGRAAEMVADEALGSASA